MPALPLLSAADSLLLIVDMQTRFAAAMPADDWARARDGAVTLARAAAELALPVVVTRQYPQRLGDLVPELAQALPGHTECLDKTCFSARGAERFDETLAMIGRSQVVLCGMETHVCVTQTAAELVANDYAPFVVADAVCSRDPAHRDGALGRMQQAGVPLINRESALFEWLRDAGHDRFKAVSALVK